MLVCSEASFRMTSVSGIGVKVKNSSPAGLRRWNWRTEQSQFLGGPRQDPDPPREASQRVLWFLDCFCVNDPSAGSPTETLLRLLLPLDEQICMILSNRSTTEVVSRPLSKRLIDSSNR